MNISLQDLLGFVSQAVDAGIQGYINSREPRKDRIKQSDAKRYLEQQGYQTTALKRWVEAGMVKPIKHGSARNSAVWYSLTELKKAVCAVRLKKINNEEVAW